MSGRAGGVRAAVGNGTGDVVGDREAVAVGSGSTELVGIGVGGGSVGVAQAVRIKTSPIVRFRSEGQNPFIMTL